MIKNQILSTITAIILISSIALTLITSSTNAQTIPEGMNWDLPQPPSTARIYVWNQWKDRIPTHVFVAPSPNPIGVGQTLSLVMFQPQWPPAADATNDIAWYGYTLTIIKPDGTIENLGPFDSDPTGSTYTLYTPDQTGTHNVTVKFPEQKYTWSQNAAMRDFYGVTFLESTYTTTFTAQQEPVEQLTWNLPLPTEYWQRPIHGMNTEWYRISSNWLGSVKDRHLGDAWNRIQPDGTAPNSPHILWTKPIQTGGVVGGTNTSQLGNEFYTGQFYSMRLTNPIIMHGILYYREPQGYLGEAGDTIAVDLRTGQEIWRHSDMPTLSFGYYYAYENPNQHGVQPPGSLFTNNFARSFDPITGKEMAGLTGVPSSAMSSGSIAQTIGPAGEHLRYNIVNAGNNTHPDWRLTQWNSSRFIANTPSTGPKSTQPGAIINASLPEFYDWNISTPWRTGMSNVVIRSVQLGDVLIGTNGTHPPRPAFDFPETLTMWAISLKPESLGQLLWMNTITTLDENNKNLNWMAAAEGVIVYVWSPTMEWVGYDMYTGQKLWQTEPQSDWNVYAYFTMPTTTQHKSGQVSIYDGKLFTTGYVGHITAYDLYTGTQLWQYSAPSYMSIWEYYTLFIGVISENKIYTATMEHSAQTPLFKGHRIRAIDTNSGEEIWNMYGWGAAYSYAVADGVLTYLDLYDQQVYAVGKGPSTTTISIQNDVITNGNSLLIKGTVIDNSAGTKQPEQAARFPNGVPVVSDQSMGQWMEYIYMQKPRPTNTTGVDIILTVNDPNGNTYDIGTTTSDTSGNFKLLWEPPVPGEYTITATFSGSESFWPSYAETAFGVTEAQPTEQPPAQQSLPPTEMYFAVSTAAIIAAIAIIGLLILKRKP